MAKVIVIGNVAFSLFHFRGKILEEMVEMVSRSHKLVACAPDAPGQASDRLGQQEEGGREIRRQSCQQADT